MENQLNQNELEKYISKVKSGVFVRNIPLEYRNNKELALCAVSYQGWSLEFLSQFQDDFDVVLEAIKYNCLSLKFASFNLKDNDTIIKTAYSQHKNSLQYASPRLQKFLK